MRRCERRRVNVKGGGELRHFIRREPTQGPVLAAREFARSFPLRKFRAQLPQRSGLLKQKVYMRQRGGEVELRGVWYARLVKYRQKNPAHSFPCPLMGKTRA